MQSQTAIDSPLPLLRPYQSRVLHRNLAISGDSARGNYFYEVSSPPFWPGGAIGDERRGGERSQRSRTLTTESKFDTHRRWQGKYSIFPRKNNPSTVGPADLSSSLKKLMQKKKLQKTREMVHETHCSSPREKFVTCTISQWGFFSCEHWRVKKRDQLWATPPEQLICSVPYSTVPLGNINVLRKTKVGGGGGVEGLLNLTQNIKKGAWSIKKAYDGRGGKALPISASCVICVSSLMCTLDNCIISYFSL